MFQDIEPHHYHNEYRKRKPETGDYVVFYNGGRVVLERTETGMILPEFKSVQENIPKPDREYRYLFSVDGTAFFLSLEQIKETKRFQYCNMRVFRELTPSWLAFAGATASHLACWYDTHRFCGKCGRTLIHKEDERAMVCPACAIVDYPKISPVVIVGIVDGERILLTRYAGRNYKKHALVAGYIEIGESLEDGLRREIMEEVGLKVKNIRYYKSQPWAFSQSVLMGFFADLDGPDSIELDTGELAEAQWFKRSEIPRDDTSLSLTWDMIEAFRNGLIMEADKTPTSIGGE
ncbi:NAD(+) diphosphatase [Anaerolentibacter hominis]|uniref:NAD(+) diphosphatase n=1 Tax=Anaerolentibacter hominis TaxID=3079009 RepID=UPI0031B88B4A